MAIITPKMAELALFLSQKGELCYGGNLPPNFIQYSLRLGDNNILREWFECWNGTGVTEAKEICLEKLKQAYFDWCKEAPRDGGIDLRDGKVWDATAREWVANDEPESEYKYEFVREPRHEDEPDYYRWRSLDVEIPPQSSVRIDLEVVFVYKGNQKSCIKRWRYSKEDAQ